MTSYLRKTDREYRRAFEIAEGFIRSRAALGKTVTYGSLRDAIAEETGKTLGHNSYATFLDDLNRETWGRTKVAMSAIVVNADTGQPGPGLIKLLADHGIDTASEDEATVIAREQQKVFDWARTGDPSVRLDPEAVERAHKRAEDNRRRRGPI